MSQYAAIRQKLHVAILKGGALKPGAILPSYAELARRFGGSTMSVMMAVKELERDGRLTRLSPRRLAVATAPANDRHERTVGLLDHEGHLYGEFANRLALRLYDRNYLPFAVNVTGSGEGDSSVARWCSRFFQSDFRVLIVRDHIEFPVDSIQEFRARFRDLILTFSPYNLWQIPHHGVFVDQAFPVDDALTRLYAAGFHRVHCLAAVGSPPGVIHPRDRRETGLERFRRTHASMRPDFRFTALNWFDLQLDEAAARRWAAELSPDTDAVVAPFDYAAVHVKSWIKRWSRVPLEQITFVGVGNTPWSVEGPDPFASYDYRVDDLVEMTLELIDKPPGQPLVRRIKPRLVREELLTRR